MASEDTSITKQNTRSALPDGESVFGVILALTAILTAGGYTVTQVHINRYTGITTYSIVPAQFLAAGLSLVLSAVGALAFALLTGIVFEALWSETRIGKRINKFIHARIYKTESVFTPEFYGKLPYFTSLGLFSVAMPLGFFLYLLNNPSLAISIILITGFILIASAAQLLPIGILFVSQSAQNSDGAANSKLVLNQRQKIVLNISVGLLSGLGLLVYIMILGWFYGSFVYSLIPRSLGGGQAVVISIAFRDSANAESLGLLPNEQAQVANVCLLAELTDGILVYNPAQQRTVAIQTGAESNVLGYFDDHTPLNCSPPGQTVTTRTTRISPTPEATAEFTPEVTEESTPEATP